MPASTVVLLDGAVLRVPLVNIPVFIVVWRGTMIYCDCASVMQNPLTQSLGFQSGCRGSDMPDDISPAPFDKLVGAFPDFRIKEAPGNC